MSLALYAHPFSAYCQKVLIALYENATPFSLRMLADAEVGREFAALWPLKRMPILRDDGGTIIESSVIIEHLALHHAGHVHLLPGDPKAALDVRFMRKLDQRWSQNRPRRVPPWARNSKSKPREHVVKLNPYLSFNGNCEAAFKFYERALGGKILMMMPFEGSPMADQMPANFRNKIIHARLAVGEETLMGSDATPDRYETSKGITVCLGTDKPEDADRIFQALSEKATVSMPIQKTFWAQRFGMLTDQFGVPWMINCETPQ